MAEAQKAAAGWSGVVIVGIAVVAVVAVVFKAMDKYEEAKGTIAVLTPLLGPWPASRPPRSASGRARTPRPRRNRSRGALARWPTRRVAL